MSESTNKLRVSILLSMTDKMKVSLFSVPVEEAGSLLNRERSEAPLGIKPKVAIVSLITCMKKNGYRSGEYDFYDIDMIYPDDSDITRYLLRYQPKIIGLSAVVSSSYTQVRRISCLIKESLPDTLVVMGGNLASSAEAILKHTDVDICVVGDGEIAWVSLLKYIESVGCSRFSQLDSLKLKEIKGLCFLHDNRMHFSGFGERINANKMVYPDYEVLKLGLKDRQDLLQNYFPDFKGAGWFNFDDRSKENKYNNKKMAGIFTSKGCVAKCTFCQRSTKGYRVLPILELAQYLQNLKEKYNVSFIQILDENFGSNKQHAYQVAKTIHNAGMLWMATGVRVNSVTRDDIRYFKKNGCSGLGFGIESGSQKMLDMMEKVFRVEDVKDALGWCIDEGIYTPIAALVGVPGENEDTAIETGSLVGEIASKIGVHPLVMGVDIYYAMPFPGTPLWEYGQYCGIIGRGSKNEADFLERIADVACYQRYYVNLNGAPMSEVIFWETLVKLEASRSYNLNTNINVNKTLSNIYSRNHEISVKNNPRLSLKYKSVNFSAISYFIDNKVIGNSLIDRIPRVIIYPIIKYLLYFEYLIQYIHPSNKIQKNYNLYRKINKVPRITLWNKNVKSAKAKSLRATVESLRDNFGAGISDEDNIRIMLMKGL